MSLGMVVEHLRNRKPTRKCERCGLRFKFDEQNCPHCYGLNEVELSQLLQQIKAARRGNSEFGRKLLFAAVVGVALVMLIALAA